MSTYYNWFKTVATNTSDPCMSSHLRAFTSEFYYTLHITDNSIESMMVIKSYNLVIINHDIPIDIS